MRNYSCYQTFLGKMIAKLLSARKSRCKILFFCLILTCFTFIAFGFFSDVQPINHRYVGRDATSRKRSLTNFEQMFNGSTGISQTFPWMEQIFKTHISSNYSKDTPLSTSIGDETFTQQRNTIIPGNKKLIVTSASSTKLFSLFEKRFDPATFAKTHKAIFAKESCACQCICTNWSTAVVPQIQLDPNRFLYPGLVGGPNNQLVGLLESIYIAIRLNRTLVVPYFHKHLSTRIVPPDRRINVNKLRNFVSCISVEELRRRCSNSFDVILKAKGLANRQLLTFETDTKMNIFNRTEVNFHQRSSVPIQILPKAKVKTKKFWIESDERFVRKMFGTSERCAIYAQPFHSLKMQYGQQHAVPLSSSTKSASRVEDNNLFSAIIEAVRRPSCIVNAASRFVAQVFHGNPYAAIHWRYDKKDWYRYHCVVHYGPKFRNACEILPSITARDIASGVENMLREETSDHFGLFVYIASPPSVENFTKQIYDSLEFLVPLEEKNYLKNFFSMNFQSCWKDLTNFMDVDEIVSLTEMEIMVRSKWFFYSFGSTWSENIRPLRKVGSGFSEADVLSLVRNALLKQPNRVARIF